MSWIKGMKLRIACNKLRIDPNDGSPVVEYQIENGGVECRTIATCSEDGVASAAQWEPLTPAQIASQILANTTVAYWLYHRLDTQSLFQICSQHPSFLTNLGIELYRRKREVAVGEFTPFQAIPAR
jgi:hypothetical protein